MSSKEIVYNTMMSDFLPMSLSEQLTIMGQVNINDLGDKNDLPLLKKYIAMKVLVAAKQAASERSSLNITSKFRDMCSFFAGSGDLQFEVLPSSSKGLWGEKVHEIKEGYRIGYISEIGLASWERRFFSLGIDDKNNLLLKSTKTIQHLGAKDPLESASELEIVDKLNDETELREIFARIKQETRYDNTLGFDLFFAAMFCANGLLYLSNECCNFFCIPIAILLNVAIYAAVIPTVLALTVMEHLVINPIKWVVEAVMPDEHEEFIQEVAQIGVTH